MELLVAMVISSLVIGASYVTYDIVYKQFLSFKQVDRNVLDALTLRNVLNNDIAAGEFLYKVNNGVRIIGFEKEEYQYTFGSEFIVRNEGATRDTFLVASGEVKYNEVQGLSVGQGLLDKFEMVIIVNDAQNILSFHKQYGANLLMLTEGTHNK